MSSIVIASATVNAADRTVLRNVTLTIGHDTRLALVGPNGVGKTTLLCLLAGGGTPDEGTVDRRPPQTTVGLLPQERDRRPGEPAIVYLRRRTGVAAAEEELNRAATTLANGQPGADDAYAAALDRYLALGGPDLDTRVPGVLGEVGLDESVLDRPTTALSGGQLARLALASLLLDEPTNDLDLDGVELLETHLAERPGGLVVVSHDRVFLERTAHEVAEIDEFSHEVRTFGGGYAAYAEERERTQRRAVEEFEAYEATRADLVEQARRQREWARSGTARVRRSGERDKFIRHARSQGAQARGAAAARIERALDRLKPVDSPRKPWDLRLTLATGSRSGGQVAALSGAVVRRGSFTLGPIDLDIRWGDRVAITGANGAGKSTLIAALLGRLPLESGSAQIGRSVVVGEIGQIRHGLPPGVHADPGLSERDRTIRVGGAHAAGEIRAGRRTTSSARSRRCRLGNEPVPNSPSSSPGRSTCWCWTSPRTTWTCPPWSSWSRHRAGTAAHWCWSPMIGACSSGSAPRTWFGLAISVLSQQCIHSLTKECEQPITRRSWAH